MRDTTKTWVMITFIALSILVAVWGTHLDHKIDQIKAMQPCSEVKK